MRVKIIKGFLLCSLIVVINITNVNALGLRGTMADEYFYWAEYGSYGNPVRDNNDSDSIGTMADEYLYWNEYGSYGNPVRDNNDSDSIGTMADEYLYWNEYGSYGNPVRNNTYVQNTYNQTPSYSIPQNNVPTYTNNPTGVPQNPIFATPVPIQTATPKPTPTIQNKSMTETELALVKNINALIELELKTLGDILTIAEQDSKSSTVTEKRFLRLDLIIAVNTVMTEGSSQAVELMKPYSLSGSFSEAFQKYNMDFLMYLNDFLFNVVDVISKSTDSNFERSLESAVTRLKSARAFYERALK